MCRTLLFCLLSLVCFSGANWKTANFDVDAHFERGFVRPEDKDRYEKEDLKLAEDTAALLEKNLEYYAKYWAGDTEVALSPRCPVEVVSALGMGNGGKTSFVFDRGNVGNWKMKIQGASLEQVIVHEVNHIVFACIFRRPLPRWIDEGAAMHVEGPIECTTELERVGAFAKKGVFYRFSDVFQAAEYPEGDNESDLVFYSQSYLMANYLFTHGDEKKYVEFIREGCKHDEWDAALKKFYGLSAIDLQLWCWTEAHQHGKIPALPVETVAFRTYVPKNVVENIAKPVPAPSASPAKPPKPPKPVKQITSSDRRKADPMWTRRRSHGWFRRR